jgi:hypothetical protein
MWHNHINQTIQTVSNHCCARLKILHPTNFEPHPSWNVWSYGIKNYSIEVHLNGITWSNIMKSYHAVQDISGGNADWWFYMPTFIFAK